MDDDFGRFEVTKSRGHVSGRTWLTIGQSGDFVHASEEQVEPLIIGLVRNAAELWPDNEDIRFLKETLIP